MHALDRNRLLYGTDEAVPDASLLVAGPVVATLEAGALRWVRYRGIEVLRGIAFLVRDRVWNTAPTVIENVRIESDDNGFVVTFDARCRTTDGDLAWQARIEGSADGTVRFAASATPTDDVWTNRTGFVVLHPLKGVAGEPVHVTDVNGDEWRMRFPRYVDPEPCFTDVRALRHRVAGDLWATVSMEGDAWETEDHRNWLDASFKTYVRPLRLPYPYVLPAGEPLRQTVTVSFRGATPAASVRPPRQEAEIDFASADAGTMPRIGLRVPVAGIGSGLAQADALRALGVQFLNATINLRAPEGASIASRAAELADRLGVALALQVIAASDDVETELDGLAAGIGAIIPRLESLLVVAAETRIRLDPGPPPPPVAYLERLYAAARGAFPGTRIGGGTLGAFAEFNRNLPPVGLVDFVAYTAASLVHAADDATLIENIETLADQAATVRALCGAMPCRLAAAGIGIDEGPFCGTVDNAAMTRMTLANADPRERGLFGAAWTLALLAEVAAAGFEAVSPASIAGALLSKHGPTPAGRVVAGMARAAGSRRLPLLVTGDKIAALGHASDAGTSLWIANLSPEPQKVALPPHGAAFAAVLDEHGASAAAGMPDFLHDPKLRLTDRRIEIGAFGVAHVRFEDRS